MDNINRFPIEVLPLTVQKEIEHREVVQQLDPNLLGLSFLSAIAGTIGNNVSVDNGKYVENAPALMCVMVAPPSCKKSAILNAPLSFLMDVDKDLSHAYKEELSAYDVAEGGGKPKKKKNVYQNCTMEAIESGHNINQRGVIRTADEMTGMIADFNKYNKGGGDRQTFMKMHNTMGAWMTDTKHGEPIHIDKPCFNFIGGIQDEMTYLLAKGTMVLDGFFFRLLFTRFVPKGFTESNTQRLDKDILSNTYNLFKDIYSYPHTELIVSDELIEAHLVWVDENKKRYHYDSFNIQLQGKLETYFWRFVIIFEVVEQTATETKDEVSMVSLEKAIKLCEYFRIESNEIYNSTQKTPLELESLRFQKLYKELEDSKEYQRMDLVEHFKDIFGKSSVDNRLVPSRKLFEKVSNGSYIKTIPNV